MSKIKAALVTLMLGTSTAAMASPSVSFSAGAQVSWGTQAGPMVRDHRYEPAAPTTSWISLAEPLRLARGRDVIRPQMGSFSQIRLQAANGMSFIQNVTVLFTDGTSQRI